MRFEFKQRDGCALMHEQRDMEKPEEERRDNLFCINSRYAFSLNRKTSAGAWTIWRLSPRSNERSIFQDPPDVSVQRWSTFGTDFGLASTLPVGPPAPGFSIEKVSSESHEGRDLVKVEFKYTAPNDKPKVPSLVGWASYDPNRYWVLTGFDVQRTWTVRDLKGPNAATYEYQDTRDGCPILKRIVTRNRNIRPDGTFDLSKYMILIFGKVMSRRVTLLYPRSAFRNRKAWPFREVPAGISGSSLGALAASWWGSDLAPSPAEK